MYFLFLENIFFYIGIVFIRMLRMRLIKILRLSYFLS